MRFIVMFVTAVCVLFLIKLRWPKKNNFCIFYTFFKLKYLRLKYLCRYLQTVNCVSILSWNSL